LCCGEGGKNLRYLITGGAGFIGSALAKCLRSQGSDVTVLDDMSRGSSVRLMHHGSLAGDLQIVQGDVRDPEIVLDAARGCDMIIHAAYLQGTQNFYSSPVQVLDVAICGMLSVLGACENLDIRHLMVVSSSEAYQVAPAVPTPEDIPLVVPDVRNPRFSYGGGKILHELLASAWVAEDKLDQAIVVRPHNVIGPDMGREHVIPQFAIRMNGLARTVPAGVIEFPILGTGQETRSFCWIDDCISQLALILGSAPPGLSTYHVGSMDEHTVSEVAEAVAACYDREIKIIPGKLAEGSPPRRLPDTSRVQALGYLDPPLPFAGAVSRTVDWYKAHG
jgi:nucleoside-diphosphate-sugar epimerase